MVLQVTVIYRCDTSICHNLCNTNLCLAVCDLGGNSNGIYFSFPFFAGKWLGQNRPADVATGGRPRHFLPLMSPMRDLASKVPKSLTDLTVMPEWVCTGCKHW